MLLLTVAVEDPRHLKIMRWIEYSKVDSADSSQRSLDKFDQKFFSSNHHRVSVALTKIHIALEQDANANLDHCFKFNNGGAASRWNCFYSNLQEDLGVKSQIKAALQSRIDIDDLSKCVNPFKFTEDHLYQMKSQLLRESKPSNCGRYARLGLGLGLILGSLAGLGALVVSATFGAPAIIGLSVLGCLAMGLGAYLINKGYGGLRPARNQDRYNRLRDVANVSINGDGPSSPPMATAVGSETPYRSYSDLEAGGAKAMSFGY